ncbi:2Fe-2S iron-sulfur cluster-binding protein [Streptomyces longwoodensis]|uniref:2Fe-2S iron-sulfur cluster-binding protein n=1 Tax=Streptomyces longwoodensis TaxID=68231 RepID=UPI00381E50E5
MTDDQHADRHGQDAPRSGGRWDPLPQGEYDDGATAFVQLPEGGIDALLSGDSPLAAPGQYVPPQIQANTPHEGAPAPGDTGTGAWAAPAGGVQWPEPGPPTSGGDRFTYHPGATGQWTFDDTAAHTAGPPTGVPEPAPGPGHDVTGQWSIPVAGGDLPDESGEFTTSSLVEQWGGGSPPATLPGGAPAPWATGPADHDPGAADPHGGDTPGGEAHGGDAWGRQPGDGDTHGGQGFDPHGGQGHDPHGGTAHDPHGGQAHDTHGGQGFDPHGGGVPVGYADAGHPADAGQQGAHPASHGTPDAPGDARHPAHDAEPSYGHGPVEGVQPLSEAPASHDGTGDAPGSREAADAAHRAAATDGDTPPAEDTDADTGPDPAGTAEAPETQDAPADGTDGAVHPDGREQDDVPPPQALHEEHPLASYVLRVNGSDRPVTDAWIGESLLYVLRERLGLAGAKDGCSQGECGACSVQVDGRLVASCLVPAVTTAGSEIRTVEGLAVDGQPSDVQRALARCGAVQCGFCVPGMAMTVHDLLEGNPAPTELEARQALCGNLCRCSGYRGVLRAVQEVVAERDTHAGGDDDADGDEARIPHQAGPGAGGVHASAFDPAPHHGRGQTHGPGHGQAYGQGQDGGQA